MTNQMIHRLARAIHLYIPGFKNYHKIAVRDQNFDVLDVPGQIPKSICQSSHLLPSAFLNTFS